MYRYRSLYFIFLGCLALVSSCLEPYAPPADATNLEFLVVDGFLNTSNGTATVSIQHSIPLASDEAPRAEIDAVVAVLDDEGSSFELHTENEGVYAAVGINFQSERKYMLSIRTTAGKTYESDFISLKRTPPIDSVTWSIENGNTLGIYVNTHDPEGKSRYYKWNYSETFMYTSKYSSNIILKDGEYFVRPISQQTYTCWKTEYQSSTKIGTTAHLAEDIVSRKKLVTIPDRSLKVSRRYSILVEQETLSEEAYNYWLDIQKTTETLGGLFDPIPAKVIGNIHNVNDPAEEVIGFFSGGEKTEKRIFISASELRPPFHFFQYPACEIDTLLLEDLPIIRNSNALITGAFDGPALIGFTTADAICVDCRLFGGGDTTKPEFWPE
jgi:hypothetical protein